MKDQRRRKGSGCSWWQWVQEAEKENKLSDISWHRQQQVRLREKIPEFCVDVLLASFLSSGREAHVPAL